MICLRLLYITLVLVLVNACASSPESNYYQLTAMQKGAVKPATNKTFVLDPVDIPELLERQHIVSYGDLESKLIISTLHLWASDLSEMISDTSVITLGGYFPESNVFAFPAPRHLNADYRIAIRIQEFAGQLGGRCSLQAQWLVTDAKDQVKVSRSVNFARDNHSADYSSYVETLNKLVGDLNSSIADSLVKL